MTPLLILAVALTVPLLFTAVRVPAAGRLAVRSLVRRPTEALLVAGGAMLGTAIIAASLVTGDVIDASVASGADNYLGPVDVRVRTTDAGDVAALADDVAALGSSEVDGLLPYVFTTGSVVAGERGDAGVTIAEVDLADARAFGGVPEATGLGGVDGLAVGQAVLARPVAEELGVAAGDTVTVHAFGQQRDLMVAHVADARGLVGYGEVLTTTGTITAMAPDPAAPGLFGEVLVSLQGGVRDAAAPSEALLASLRDVADDHAAGVTTVDVHPIKQDLLDEAEETGTAFTTLFSSIGSFAVIAGILLLVNLFVMLAEERRRDQGTLRALGMRRGLLARTFTLEGALYAAVAAVAGVAVGAVVGLGVAWVAGSIFAITEGGLTFEPVIEPGSLLTAGLLGYVISLSTAWILSVRIARANVIRSLRELPEPLQRPRVRTLVLAGIGVLSGTAMTVLGAGGDVAEAIIAGLPLALLSAVPIARRFVPVEAAMSVAGAGSVAWALLATQVWGDAFAEAEMTVFVVQGVVLTAGAISVLVALDRGWGRLADVVSARTGGIAGRLGTAYPLARRFRTSMLLGMFAIVVFTMTFIAAIDGVFSGQAEQFAADTGGGYDLLVTAPASATAAADTLAEQPDVDHVAALQRGAVDVVVDDHTTGWPLTVIDQSLLAATPPPLAARAEGYADDAAVYAAVLADPSLLVVDDSFGNNGGPGGAVPTAGDVVTLRSGDGATERTYTVAGVLAGDMVWHGGFVSADGAEGIVRPGPAQRFYVVVDGDAAAVASRLDADLVSLGVDAGTFQQFVEEEVAEQSSFLRLLQVFLGLGLVIGVAGLGVVLVRAVRERTRQVGTLRALGVRRVTVARAFLVEAGFIAVQGVVIGSVLGLVSAWQVLTRTDTFGQMDLAFSVPAGAVALIVAVPLVAALAITVLPARRAAAIRPAVALRVAD